MNNIAALKCQGEEGEEGGRAFNVALLDYCVPHSAFYCIHIGFALNFFFLRYFFFYSGITGWWAQQNNCFVPPEVGYKKNICTKMLLNCFIFKLNIINGLVAFMRSIKC